MPKAIKRKTVKPKREENVVETLQETLKARRRIILMSAGAALLILLIAGGAFYFIKSRAQNFDELNYTGYKLFYGMGNPMPPQERYRQALEKFEEARKIKETPYTLYYIGAAQYEMGKYDEAAKTFTELKTAFPKDATYVPLADMKLATIYMKTGKNEEALKSLDAIINSGNQPLRETALWESAALLKSMGKNTEAEQRLATLKKEFPESPYLQPEKPLVPPAPAPAKK
jgi:tetratricopeptide (TPR) repeat protein